MCFPGPKPRTWRKEIRVHWQCMENSITSPRSGWRLPSSLGFKEKLRYYTTLAVRWPAEEYPLYRCRPGSGRFLLIRDCFFAHAAAALQLQCHCKMWMTFGLIRPNFVTNLKAWAFLDVWTFEQIWTFTQKMSISYASDTTWSFAIRVFTGLTVCPIEPTVSLLIPAPSPFENRTKQLIRLFLYIRAIRFSKIRVSSKNCHYLPLPFLPLHHVVISLLYYSSHWQLLRSFRCGNILGLGSTTGNSLLRRTSGTTSVQNSLYPNQFIHPPPCYGYESLTWSWIRKSKISVRNYPHFYT